MTKTNAQATILGVRALQNLERASAQVIYWNFMEWRARELRIPTETPEDMALARLCCLNRANDHNDFLSVQNAWNCIDVSSRELLISNFLADGLEQRAYIFVFLPLCMANAKSNPAIDLASLLEVVAELIETLTFRRIDIVSGSKLLIVDLSDLASFAAVVRNMTIFRTCIERSKFQIRGHRVHLELTSKNWSRTQDTETDDISVSYGIRQLLRRQRMLEERLRSHGGTSSQELRVAPKREIRDMKPALTRQVSWLSHEESQQALFL